MHKLLLADDSVTIQRVIELTFSGEDIQVIAVSDGEQAIARIPTERPDIILADIGMPKRSGYDVSAFVKEHPDLAHIPVLLLAGAFERVDEVRAQQVKCDGVLVKPFEPRHVVARVRELVAGSKAASSPVSADVPRPAERLVRPRLVDTSAPPPSEPSLEPAASNEAAAPSTFLDASLDDYFERLNAAFEDGRKPPLQAGEPEAPSDAAPRAESLDGYFDRLSAAFADLAKPSRDAEIPPSFGTLVDEEPIPTLDTVAGNEGGGVDTSADSPSTGSTEPLPTPATPALEAPARLVHETVVASAVGGRHEMPEEDADGIADVLSALLADQSEFDEGGDLSALRAGVSDQPLEHDALVDEITRRVLDRLVPEVTARLRRLVADEIENVEAVSSVRR